MLSTQASIFNINNDLDKFFDHVVRYKIVSNDHQHTFILDAAKSLWTLDTSKPLNVTLLSSHVEEIVPSSYLMRCIVAKTQDHFAVLSAGGLLVALHSPIVESLHVEDRITLCLNQI
jgi:hypothetical protein